MGDRITTWVSPYGLVFLSADPEFGIPATVPLSPDEARLYALKLIRAADKAEEA